jgi:lipopolysaccharide export LptBFGC system permease protein LptF
VQPRVFYEDFPNYVLYVQDATTSKGAAVWKGVFLADVSTTSAPQVTLAKQGVVVGEGTDRLHLHLISGAQHQTVPKQPDQYSISTFGDTDIFLPMAPTAQKQRATTPPTELSDSDLITEAKNQKDAGEAANYLIEWHRRWSMAAACLVLALVGIPLGMSAKKGGKSSGFVLTIALVFIYYLTALCGMSLARQGKLPRCSFWPAWRCCTAWTAFPCNCPPGAAAGRVSASSTVNTSLRQPTACAAAP